MKMNKWKERGVRLRKHINLRKNRAIRNLLLYRNTLVFTFITSRIIRVTDNTRNKRTVRIDKQNIIDKTAYNILAPDLLTKKINKYRTPFFRTIRRYSQIIKMRSTICVREFRSTPCEYINRDKR